MSPLLFDTLPKTNLTRTFPCLQPIVNCIQSQKTYTQIWKYCLDQNNEILLQCMGEKQVKCHLKFTRNSIIKATSM